MLNSKGMELLGATWPPEFGFGALGLRVRVLGF